MPIEWKEVKKIKPHDFTLDNYKARLKKGDLWKDMYKQGVSVRKIRAELKK